MSVHTSIATDISLQSSSHTSDTVVEQRKRHQKIVSQIRTKDPENTNNLKTNQSLYVTKIDWWSYF